MMLALPRSILQPSGPKAVPGNSRRSRRRRKTASVKRKELYKCKRKTTLDARGYWRRPEPGRQLETRNSEVDGDKTGAVWKVSLTENPSSLEEHGDTGSDGDDARGRGDERTGARSLRPGGGGNDTRGGCAARRARLHREVATSVVVTLFIGRCQLRSLFPRMEKPLTTDRVDLDRVLDAHGGQVLRLPRRQAGVEAGRLQDSTRISWRSAEKD